MKPSGATQRTAAPPISSLHVSDAAAAHVRSSAFVVVSRVMGQPMPGRWEQKSPPMNPAS